MKVLVVDAQGGGIGKQIVEKIKEEKNIDVFAVGTNSIATEAMRKAGAKHIATGENAIVVTSRMVDIIVGPIGIVIANAMLGEITPRMAEAISESAAIRILIPFRHCQNIVVGAREKNMTMLIEEAVQEIKYQLKNTLE